MQKLRAGKTFCHASSAHSLHALAALPTTLKRSFSEIHAKCNKQLCVELVLSWNISLVALSAPFACVSSQTPMEWERVNNLPLYSSQPQVAVASRGFELTISHYFGSQLEHFEPQKECSVTCICYKKVRCCSWRRVKNCDRIIQGAGLISFPRCRNTSLWWSIRQNTQDIIWILLKIKPQKCSVLDIQG